MWQLQHSIIFYCVFSSQQANHSQKHIFRRYWGRMKHLLLLLLSAVLISQLGTSMEPIISLNSAMQTMRNFGGSLLIGIKDFAGKKFIICFNLETKSSERSRGPHLRPDYIYNCYEGVSCEFCRVCCSKHGTCKEKNGGLQQWQTQWTTWRKALSCTSPEIKMSTVFLGSDGVNADIRVLFLLLIALAKQVIYSHIPLCISWDAHSTECPNFDRLWVKYPHGAGSILRDQTTVAETQQPKRCNQSACLSRMHKWSISAKKRSFLLFTMHPLPTYLYL